MIRKTLNMDLIVKEKARLVMLILLDSDYLTWHFWLQLFLTQYVNSVDLPVRRWNPRAGLMTSLYIQCASTIHLPSSKKWTPRGMSYEVNRRSVYASALLEILGYIKAHPNCFVWNEGDYGNVSLVCGSYLLDFDVRQLFVCCFLWFTHEADDVNSCLLPTVVGQFNVDEGSLCPR